MIVFKTYLKILNKCKLPILLYTVILIFFAGFNIKNNNQDMSFTASKPDIFIVNHDKNTQLTNHLVAYLKENSNVKDIEENKIDDALFYRDVNYVIIIPKHFSENFLNHQNPQIEIKSTGDYMASLAERLLNRYLKIAEVYNENSREEELVKNIDITLKKSVDIEMTSKLDTTHLEKAATYYNFSNYCIIAGCIYVVCLILSSFKNEQIHKRTMISSMSMKKINRRLLLSNSLFAFLLCLFYCLLSVVLVGKVMFTMNGLFFMLNTFLFTFCILTLAFLLGNLIRDKNAINGIINVIALGSSFLCGSFVPMKMLPSFVLKFAHILPSYYFIKNNELLKTLETFNGNTLKPIFINMGVILLFAIAFILLTNLISNKKRRIA